MGQGKAKSVAWMSPHMTGTLDRLIDDWLKLIGLRQSLSAMSHSATKR